MKQDLNNLLKLYFWPTPNGRKITIFLEEAGLAYEIHPVDIGKGDQFKPEFLMISPNNKMPAIVDPDGPGGNPIAMFESGAILMYLADKTGQFLPRETRARYDVLQWLMFQIAGIGPMLGQTHHFREYAPEKIKYAINRYTNEAVRLYGVMDRQLATREHFAGDYSIADMAIYPWIASHDHQGQDLNDFPHIKHWFEHLAARPAVRRGMAVLKEQRKAHMSDQEKEILFGKVQYQKR